MNVLILFPLKCSKRKLISSSLDEILYIRVSLELPVDHHIFQVFLAGKTEEEYELERWGGACHFIYWVPTSTYPLFKSFPEIQYWRVPLSQRDGVFVTAGKTPIKIPLFFGDQVVIPWKRNPFTPWENGLRISSGYPGALGKTEVSSDPPFLFTNSNIRETFPLQALIF